MHHLLLALPLVGLVLFLILPWPAASPLYIVVFIGSLGIYWKILQAQRRRPTIGKRAMVGDHAVVIRTEGNDVEVDYQGEIWRAVSFQPLHPGQEVIVEAIEGLSLRVAPSKPGNQSS